MMQKYDTIKILDKETSYSCCGMMSLEVFYITINIALG